MRLLVAGSRFYPPSERPMVFGIFNQVWSEWHDSKEADDTEFHVIAGHSVVKNKVPIGPDWWAEQWTKTYAYLGVTGTFISIDDVGGWDAYPGKKAAYVRNVKLAEQRPTHALFFWDGKSSGTMLMLDIINKVKPRVRRRLITPGMAFGNQLEWD